MNKAGEPVKQKLHRPTFIVSHGYSWDFESLRCTPFTRKPNTTLFK